MINQKLTKNITGITLSINRFIGLLAYWRLHGSNGSKGIVLLAFLYIVLATYLFIGVSRVFIYWLIGFKLHKPFKPTTILLCEPYWSPNPSAMENSTPCIVYTPMGC